MVLELTVPYETNMTESHEHKSANYEELIETYVTQRRLRNSFLVVKVGARGFAGVPM